MSDNLVFDCRWSENADQKFIDDFIYAENTVFNCGYSTELFHKKFTKNIYGNSVVEVVYLNDKPVAARALWRNDVFGTEAYQPCDTCVLEDCRGMGVFTQMTKKAVDFIGKTVMLYNFPNGNSRPGYLKMGWKVNSTYSPALLTSVKEYKKEHLSEMDEKYATWWLDGSSDYCYVKKGNDYFLLRSMNKPFCSLVVAIVPNQIAEGYAKAKKGLIFYRSKKKTWYNKKLPDLYIVSTEDKNLYIPPWKMDVI